MKKIIFSNVLFLMICSFGFAQIKLDKDKLDSYFKALEENNKFMGSVALSKDGKIIYTKTIGFADIENKVKANENTKYRIGSISKSFTAVLVLKAVEEKKIDLNQTIDKWFPSISNANKINIKQLLSHRSGIHNFTSDSIYFTFNTEAKVEKEMLAIIKSGGSDFEPDTKTQYSNSNYVLLTYILEKTYDKSFADLLKKYITKPLKLSNTYVFGKINTNDNECKSYNLTDNWNEEKETHFSIPLGAGAIISTPSDLTKFADALFAGKIIKTESLETMKSIKEGYGLGLFQIPFNKSIGYGHTGGIDGFSNVYAHFAYDKISYALSSNGSNFENNDISIAVLSAVYDLPYEIPTFTIYNVTSEDLDKYLGVYASNKIPLKITITKDGNTLIAQGTGQPSFRLEATDKDKFKSEKIGAKLEFDASEKTMILIQGGGKVKFTRE